MFYASLFELLRDVSTYPLKKGEEIYPTHTMPGDLPGFRLVGSDQEVTWEIDPEDLKHECLGKKKPKVYLELYHQMKFYMSRKELLTSIRSGEFDLKVLQPRDTFESIPTREPQVTSSVKHLEKPQSETTVEDALSLMGFGG